MQHSSVAMAGLGIMSALPSFANVAGDKLFEIS
ncbi:MAG: hypothetical protein KAR20_02295 [Candidatus Heimdallarchaeota archaeon]|nr:hypothetical protein [Candidatus Heimdallarchaeota archaeon]